MDAASHTGIDDVRIITENVEYKPLLGRYKVYILYEIHMLSKGAFNALLKVLDEPPCPFSIYLCYHRSTKGACYRSI